MKRIPYGIFNYKSLIEEDYLYVDKTMYLSKLESEANTIMYLRPGRFGKSLLTSMMYYYYDVNSSSLFDSLFKGTYVYSNPTVNKNNYYVLKFDFSGLDTAEKSREEIERKFKSCVKSGIKEFLEYYKVSYEINDDLGPDEIIREFLSEMSKLDHKIYILIDEYDNFTNAMLEGNAERFKSVVGNEGVVKAFYAVIKTNIGLGVVDRFFATGICPITLNSMTTGFNIVTDISANKEFNSMVGLTHEEVRNIYKELGLTEEEQEEVYDTMVENYDGYKFSKHTLEKTFNATLVMYFLREYMRERKVPEKLYDVNIAVNYGKIDNLIKLQDNNFYKDLISEILRTNQINASIVSQFNLEADFTKEDIISLLYYFGYLTIKEEDIVGNTVLSIPNQSMKETYGNYFLKMLNDNQIGVDSNIINVSLHEIILEGRVDTLTNYISEVLSLGDHKVFSDLSERDIELLYFALLLKNEKINVYTEYPCSGGFADIYISGRQEPIKYNILIEIKYINKSEYSEGLMESRKEEGVRQLKKYSMDERISRGSLRKYLVVFVGREVKLLEEII